MRPECTRKIHGHFYPTNCTNLTNREHERMRKIPCYANEGGKSLVGCPASVGLCYELALLAEVGANSKAMKFPSCESLGRRLHSRSERTQGLFWAMAALTCLAASLTPARAQIDIVIPVNQVWKYMATADDTNFCLNGTGWETTGYNDSAWPSGPGGFTGGEDTAATLTSLSGLLNTTSLPPPSLSSGRPQYFRTHFNLGATNGLSLIVSNRYDDQAVFYINGTRVGHFNHPADPEVCTITTASGGEATTWALIILSPAQLGGILHSGTDNVLAVSVHQNNAASGDMVFVCALSSTTNAISPPQPGPIPYGPAGSTNLTFDAAPPVQQWSTRTWYGSASDITDMAALDTAARTNVAALID